MTIYEFIARTGYTPTEKQFEEIHKAYMEAGEDVDKDTFCKEWKRNSGIEKASFQAQREIWVLQGAKEEAIRQAIESTKKVKEIERKMEDVLETLRKVANDRDNLQRENEMLKERNDKLKDKLVYFKQLIDAVAKTVEAVE